MILEETQFYEFVKKFFEDRGEPFEGQPSIWRGNKLPFDSVDRLIALFILENYKDLIETDLTPFNTGERAYQWYKSLPVEFQDWFTLAGNWAYNNYEREWLNPGDALFHMIEIAKGGIEAVLTDSYQNGGWFGSS